MTLALEFQDLTLGYDRHPAVQGLCGTIDKGSLTAIVGPNGAGKSTVLKGGDRHTPPARRTDRLQRTRAG